MSAWRYARRLPEDYFAKGVAMRNGGGVSLRAKHPVVVECPDDKCLVPPDLSSTFER